MDNRPIDSKPAPADRHRCDRTTRHRELHAHLDELIACFLLHSEKRLSETTVLELMAWNHEQCTDANVHSAPGCPPERRHGGQ